MGQTSAAHSKDKHFHIFGALRRRDSIDQAFGRHVGFFRAVKG